MPPSLIEIINLFEHFDGTARIELLTEFGARLPPLQSHFRVLRDSGAHVIHECQSPVFFFATVDDARLRVHADVPREAPVARGFVALLHEAFDGAEIGDLTDLPSDILATFGIRESLSLQRQRGLAAIYAVILQAVDGAETNP